MRVWDRHWPLLLGWGASFLGGIAIALVVPSWGWRLLISLALGMFMVLWYAWARQRQVRRYARAVLRASAPPLPEGARHSDYWYLLSNARSRPPDGVVHGSFCRIPGPLDACDLWRYELVPASLAARLALLGEFA